MAKEVDLERIKRLAIVAMFSDDSLMERLVLKGGNLLDIVYRISTRASLDIDLSIDGDFESFEGMKERVERAIKRTYADDGNYHRDDFPAVLDTVKPEITLRDFDYYFDYVVEKCVALEPLWNE